MDKCPCGKDADWCLFFWKGKDLEVSGPFYYCKEHAQPFLRNAVIKRDLKRKYL